MHWLRRRFPSSFPAAIVLATAILLVLAPPVGAETDAGPTLIKNSSFDRGLVGWRGNRASLALVRGVQGRAVRVTLRHGRASSFSIYRWPRPVTKTTAGSMYRAGASVKGPQGHRLCLRVRELTARSRTVAVARRCLTANGRWQSFRPLDFRARRDGSRLGLAVVARRAAHHNRFRADTVTLDALGTPASTKSGAVAGPAGPAVGVHFHGLWETYDDSQRATVIDRMAEAGLRWLRIDISWCSFEGARGDFNSYWTELLDQVVDRARARGLQVLGNVICTPAWATTCGGCSWDAASPMPPTDAALFGDFMRQMAERYRGRIAAWEIWNEPNEFNHQFWNASEAEYVRLLLRPGYNAVKQADPNATVVTGGTSYADEKWIERLYAAGARGLFDALGVHPYMAPWNLPPETDNNTKWTITHVDAIRREMRANGDDKPIWFTELGWSSSFPAYAQGVTEEQQADYTVRAIRLVRERFPYVTQMFFYNDRDRSSSNVRENGFGLLRNDLSPKPVFTALRSLLNG